MEGISKRLSTYKDRAQHLTQTKGLTAKVSVDTIMQVIAKYSRLGGTDAALE